MRIQALLSLVTIGLLGACASQSPMVALYSQAGLPEAVKVPAGHSVSMETAAAGDITYQCRAKKDMAGAFEWAFVAPVATLVDMKKASVGKYYGGPTWEANDGSKVTGKQLAVAPAGAGNIPLQLVKAEPAMGNGAMTGTSYIQRLETKGGVAPSATCDASTLGATQQVKYEAKYAFYAQQ